MAKNFEIGFWANTRGIPAYEGSSLGLLEASRYLSSDAPFKPSKELTVLGALAERAVGAIVVYHRNLVVTDQLTNQYGLNGYSYGVPRLYVAELLPEELYAERINDESCSIWAKEAYCALNGISTQVDVSGKRASDAVTVREYETTQLPEIAEGTVRMVVSRQK